MNNDVEVIDMSDETQIAKMKCREMHEGMMGVSQSLFQILLGVAKIVLMDEAIEIQKEFEMADKNVELFYKRWM